MELQCVQVPKGDTWTISIEKVDATGNPVSVAGFTYFSTIKRRLSDTDAAAASAVQTDPGEHDDEANGVSHVTHPSENTDDLEGDYHFDIREKDADGNISTIVVGVVTFLQHATRRTA